MIWHTLLIWHWNLIVSTLDAYFAPILSPVLLTDTTCECFVTMWVCNNMALTLICWHFKWLLFHWRWLRYGTDIYWLIYQVISLSQSMIWIIWHWYLLVYTSYHYFGTRNNIIYVNVLNNDLVQLLTNTIIILSHYKLGIIWHLYVFEKMTLLSLSELGIIWHYYLLFDKLNDCFVPVQPWNKIAII